LFENKKNYSFQSTTVFHCFQPKVLFFYFFIFMNIYISNLSFKVEDGDLRQLFEEYGEVSSAKVVTDKFTGRSRGFGFVEMPDNDASLKAIEELNQAEYDGRVINVNEARPREDKPRNNNHRGGGRGDYGDRQQNRRW
jgi:RNA recognition motif-containing protein